MDGLTRGSAKVNHRSEYASLGRIARGGNSVLSFIAVTIVVALLSYAFYSLLYTYQVYNNSFLDSEILELKPVFNGDETDNRLTFRELLAVNKDTTSWVTIDGTFIDYPVMQGEDNYEYVNKNIYGNFELAGSIFLASENSSDYSDPYNLLFGHNIAGGGMFGDVMKYKALDYFNKKNIGILYLPDATYSIDIYACVECNAYDDNIFYGAKEQSEMAGFQQWLKKNASHYRDIGVTEHDKIIALTTCENATTDGRCAIIGKLTQISMLEQSFDNEDDVPEENERGQIATGESQDASNYTSVLNQLKIFSIRDCYNHLIILASGLISIVIIMLAQKHSYSDFNMAFEEMAEAEHREEIFRRIINDGLLVINIGISGYCLYHRECIWEPICAAVVVGIMLLLVFAERIRRRNNHNIYL